MSPGSDPLSSNHSPRAARRGHGGASSASSPPTPKQGSHDAAAISTPERSDRSPPISTLENASTSSDAPPQPPPPSDGPEHVINGNCAGKGKKPAWNMPSNGASDVGPVMGAVSWPPLSVSIKASSKSSSSDSLKNLSDGSIAAPQGGSVVAPSNNPNPISAPNLNSTRLGEAGGGGGALANGGSPPPQSPPALVETDRSVKEKQSGAEPSLKEGSDLPSKSSNSWDHVPRGGGSTSRHHGGGNYHRAYGGGRRGGNNGGGGGGYGNRRGDHARGGYDWNSHRNYSNRDGQSIPQQQQQQCPPLPPLFRPPPPASMPFVGAPTPVPPFFSPVGFSESSYPIYLIPQHPPVEQLRNMSFAPHQVFHTQADLQHLLMRQIDYYFSPENLCKDVYLRQQMDDQGWVRLSVIANFNKVKQLTNNIQLILEVVRGSTIVEVQGMRIRRRIDWRNWILPPFSNQYGTTSGPQSSTQPSPDYRAGRIYGVRLEEGDEGASISCSTTGQNPT